MQSGGRSIARVLNWVLLVLGVVVGFAAVFMCVAALAFAFIPAFRDEFLRQAAEAGAAEPVLTVPWGIASMALVVVLAFLLLLRLRKVVVTVERGNPFHPDNPRNIRILALLLALIEIVRWGTVVALAGETISVAEDIDSWFSSALSVLIVVVLAEVFREGTRLRAESELTV